MVVELLTPLAGWALGKTADTAWTLATNQVQTKLQRTDIERAIKAGLAAVREWEQPLDVTELLFKACDDKQKRHFLEQAFAAAGVVEQLQRPLKGKGEPNVELLQQYFEQIADDTDIKLMTGSLRQWLTIFSSTYFEKTALFIKYKVARQCYLQQLAYWYDDVKFLGLSVAGQEDTKSEKLMQIFVMPDVKQRSVSSHGEHLYQLTDELPEATSSQQVNLMSEQRQLTTLLKQEGQNFSAEELLKQRRSHRFVLLGAPGSGKTTLMSYFAVSVAIGATPVNLELSGEYLPILVRIRDWVRSAHTNLLDYVRWFATDKLTVKNLPSGFFEYCLEAGKALILLDGLDEVANESRRDEVVNQIECFLQHDQYRQNPAIITSRPAGYKQAYFRTEAFPHYDLLPFDQAKVNQFIENWYENRFRDREESQRRQQTLKKALSERDRIQLLAKNPLLLTIIALIHRYEAYLPRDRHQLYNRAVETLLTNWDANKDLDYQWPLDYLKRDAVRRMMERLAYWIHTHGSSGDVEGGTLIDREELIYQLSDFIAEEGNIKRYQAIEEAKRFLNYIRNRTGLLNEQGQGCYAFVHKTFQEYLCAQEIKYRADEEYDEELILNPIREHLHEPHWEEVLLLLIAQQPKKRVAKIIQHILDHPTPYEQWLHRNVFFAGACLAENVELTDPQLTNYILDTLIGFAVSNLPLISTQLRQQAERCLKNLGETNFQDVTLQRSKTLQDQIDAVSFQEFRFSLGQEVSAIAELVYILSNEKSVVRSRAASALGRLGKADDSVVRALIDSLNDNKKNIRSRAAWALGQLDNTDEVVLQALFCRLSDMDRDVCSETASALGRLGKTDDVVVQALIASLRDKESIVRFNAASALGQLGNADETVAWALVASLSDNESDVRSNAAAALGELGNTDEAVIQALVASLNDNAAIVRFRAAPALGQLGNANEAVVQALIARLSDKESIVRSRAASALGELGNAYEAVVQALISSLEDSDRNVRSNAASALGKLDNTDEVVMQAIIARLDDSDRSVRSSASYALGQLDNAHETVVQVLIASLDDREAVVRSNAASALGKLSIADETVVQALFGHLSDRESAVRSKVASALGKLGKQPENTIVPPLVYWIEQHQQTEYVGYGIDALWSLMTEQG